MTNKSLPSPSYPPPVSLSIHKTKRPKKCSDYHPSKRTSQWKELPNEPDFCCCSCGAALDFKITDYGDDTSPYGVIYVDPCPQNNYHVFGMAQDKVDCPVCKKSYINDWYGLLSAFRCQYCGKNFDSCDSMTFHEKNDCNRRYSA